MGPQWMRRSFCCEKRHGRDREDGKELHVLYQDDALGAPLRTKAPGKGWSKPGQGALYWPRDDGLKE